MLRLRCPECWAPLKMNAYSCDHGHQFTHDENGVLQLVSAEFQAKLNKFLPAFQNARSAENKRLLDPIVYPTLPYGQDGAAWRVRQYDLDIVQRQLANRSPQHILEIGAWNGWLTHHLAAWQHQVVAVGEFTDAHDGLGARRHYAEQWCAIQTNSEQLDVFANTFDVIILNRCLPFFPDPLGYIKQVQNLLASNGLLIATGLGFYKNAAAKARLVSAEFERQTQLNAIPFRYYKGYLDNEDAAAFSELGLQLHGYPQPRMRAGNLLGRWQQNRPMYRYAVYQAVEGKEQKVRGKIAYES